MTEAEWLNGWCYPRMYDVVRNRATTRQTRLYMVACCRLKVADFFDPRIMHSLQTAERCADDPQTEAVANAVQEELVASLRPQLPQTGQQGEIARAIQSAWQLLEECWCGVHYKNPQHAISHAAFMCLRGRPRQVFTGGEGNAAELCACAIECADSLLRGVKPEEIEQYREEVEQRSLVPRTAIREAIADLLRDIFGNPFRIVTGEPAWLTWNGGTVTALAREIYEERRFEDMPILADALEDAGCRDEAVLGHLRGPGEHIRGCWCVDLLMNRL
jgi:hypothetical protein